MVFELFAAACDGSIVSTPDIAILRAGAGPGPAAPTGLHIPVFTGLGAEPVTVEPDAAEGKKD